MPDRQVPEEPRCVGGAQLDAIGCRIETRRFQFLQDACSAKPDGAKLVTKAPPHLVAQRTAAGKQSARALDRGRQRVPALGAQANAAQVFLARAMRAQLLEGEIDPSAREVDLQILPEVGELKRRADGVGLRVEPRIA